MVCADSAAVRSHSRSTALLVVEESVVLVGEGVDEDIRPAIVVVIGEIDRPFRQMSCRRRRRPDPGPVATSVKVPS